MWNSSNINSYPQNSLPPPSSYIPLSGSAINPPNTGIPTLSNSVAADLNCTDGYNTSSVPFVNNTDPLLVRSSWGDSKKKNTASRLPTGAPSEDGKNWKCPTCGNMNWAWRNDCNRCKTKAPKEVLTVQKEDKPFRQKVPNQKPTDWECEKCHNINWDYRKTCNKCDAPKPGLVKEEPRTGLGGGYYERQDPSDRVQHEDSDDEFDDFGRRKKGAKKDSKLAELMALNDQIRGDIDTKNSNNNYKDSRSNNNNRDRYNSRSRSNSRHNSSRYNSSRYNSSRSNSRGRSNSRSRSNKDRYNSRSRSNSRDDSRNTNRNRDDSRNTSRYEDNNSTFYNDKDRNNNKNDHVYSERDNHNKSSSSRNQDRYSHSKHRYSRDSRSPSSSSGDHYHGHSRSHHHY
ncbi:hypothetical protein WA158_004623 [Blastocystis sp. Blastoise]